MDKSKYYSKRPRSPNIQDLREDNPNMYYDTRDERSDKISRKYQKRVERAGELAYRKDAAPVYDKIMDDNKRGEPMARRRRPILPKWYTKERFGYKRKD